MKVSITYVGEAGSNVWGGVDRLPEIVFEKNKPVTIDLSDVPGNHKGFYTHVVKKARANRFFEVKDVAEKKAVKTVTKKAPVTQRAGAPRRGDD